jgi:hypothetical protein
MIDISRNELVFTFPDVDDAAELRVHFRSADLPE